MRSGVWTVGVLAVGLGLCGPAGAQDEPEEDLEQKLERLEEEMKELRKQLEEEENPPEVWVGVAAPDDDAPTDDTPRAMWSWIQENFKLSITLNTFYVGADHNNVNPPNPEFDGSVNTFTVAQFELDIWTEFEFGVDFRVDLDTTEDDQGLSSTNGQINYPDDLVVEQAYVQVDLAKLWGIAPLKFRFGRFNAPIGFEPIDAPGLWQFSRSNVAVFLTPQNLVGASLIVETEYVDGEAYVVNGWDTNDDPDNEKSFGGRVTLKLFDKGDYHIVRVSPAILSGHEPSGTRSGDLRTVFDLVVVVQPVEMVKLAFEFNQGHESRPAAQPNNKSSKWWGYQVSMNVKPVDWFGVTLRGDYINDRDGVQTGFKQHLWSGTAALLFKIPLGNDVVEHMFINLEYRYDRSNRRIFTNHQPASTGDERHRSQAAFQMFFFF